MKRIGLLVVLAFCGTAQAQSSATHTARVYVAKHNGYILNGGCKGTRCTFFRNENIGCVTRLWRGTLTVTGSKVRLGHQTFLGQTWNATNPC